ncbi:MAG: bifunctional phosphoribosylaminoimidazolecarboxamide formyltransferase/IMP cyclohydrolase, partial [Bdellovibrionales bacterium]|nr:bifunctional phosphoribosylaminoimidazolecarboxamide formyltransferase/IMP cyclohydrolase [Bdellovibrionales bacterium]
TRYALLSVSDRDGIDSFAVGLQERGFTLLTTSGTGKFLREKGIESQSIEEYTGQLEILGGRVKTLHPKIHGGILARRNIPEDIRDLEAQDIAAIDVVVVNLYPFEAKLQELKSDSSGDVFSQEKIAKLIEYIDIGGPTMIRAAAKNCAHVYAVIDPADYPRVLACLESESSEGGRSAEFAALSPQHQLRLELSSKVFSALAQYNLEIGKFLSQSIEVLRDSEEVGIAPPFSKQAGVCLVRTQALRYGENPHQPAALYRDASAANITSWEQLSGKELSYNNILDADAGFRITQSLYRFRDRFRKGSMVNIVKHLSPCGVAVGSDAVEALQRAKASDPRSHFGGIIGFTEQVSKRAAEEVVRDFCEIVVAPDFSQEALNVFSSKPNIRLLRCNMDGGPEVELRSTLFGYLAQGLDLHTCAVGSLDVVAGPPLQAELLHDLELAWCLVGPIKSNAVAFVKDQQLLASGGGQTSRIDAVEVAIYKAKEHGHDLRGAVASSDAFFPFPDSIERLAEVGIQAVVTPGGSVKDPLVIEKAKELGVTLIFTPERHFRH